MKNITPKLAVVTRTRDRTYLLGRALDSLYTQTVKDFVHVVVNDGGSTEEVDAVLAKFPYKNRVVIHNSHQKGLVAALNQGIQAVNSEYISILDDDDTWHKERIEKVLRHFNDNPNCMVSVVKMDTVIEDIVDGKVKKIDQFLHPDSGDGEISLYKQCIRNYISNGIITYAREAYDELGGYDEDLATSEDWDFGLRLMLKYDVDLIRGESLFYYHQRPKVIGALGNSVHAGVRVQEITLNKIRNKFLREDLRKGKLGVGYIMNQAVFDLGNVVRLEGHMNYIAEGINRELTDTSRIETIVRKNQLSVRLKERLHRIIKRS